MPPMTLDQAMRTALEHHNAGRFAEAETIYCQVLAQFPAHVGALRLLGMLAGQAGRADVAIDLIGRAIAVNPHDAEYHNDLGSALKSCGRPGEALDAYLRAIHLDPCKAHIHNNLALLLQEMGRPDDAFAAYERAIRLNPEQPEIYCNLGHALWRGGRLADAMVALERAIQLRPELAEAHNNLGNVLKDQGRLEDAIAAFRRAIQLRPELAEAHSNLGDALWSCGRLDDAIAALERAVQLRPNLAEAHNNLGNVLKDQGRLEDAIAALERAVQLRPDFAEAYNNLGSALSGHGRHGEAIVALERAIQLRPDLAVAYSSLGSALWGCGRLDEAIAALKCGIQLQPDLAVTHNGLGNVLKEQGRLDEAIAAYDRAIRLNPEQPEIYCNLGNALWRGGRLEEAIVALERAIRLRPELAEAHNNLGIVFKHQGRLDEALRCFRRAVEVQPGLSKAASNLLFTLHFHPGFDAQAILAEHRTWARQFAAPLSKQIAPHENDSTPDRKLRIGFVSPDLRDHAVGQLLVPLFTNHDPRSYQFICYSDAPVADAISAKLKALSARWHDTFGQSDAQVADIVRADRIDILVDLALHTAGNRMLVFARKPAPVQVTMLGLPATTGLDTIDHRLTDPYLDPPGQTDADYTERSIRLPHCFWVFSPPDAADTHPVSPLPALSNGFVTFGCLNQFAKVTGPALELWVKILQAVPQSRLVLQSPPGRHLDPVRALFAQGGIGADRLAFVPRADRREFHRRLGTLDVALDSFPYNGHTSTLDALWMGVPVVTLAGRTAVGRGGVSILSNLGIPELIAPSCQEYVTTAVEWARDLVRLSELRLTLRARMRSSPLMNGRQFSADVEDAFRRVWKLWCRQ
jgi:predicted O-linked N-acetylglucosamine transferase (SPINDLY family)